MGKRLPHTPNSSIKSALRRLFLRSRERAAVLRGSGYTCAACGLKQSKAKGREVYVEVHHLAGVCNWDKLYEAIRQHLLCSPDDMVCLCSSCHSAAHDAVEEIASVTYTGSNTSPAKMA